MVEYHHLVLTFGNAHTAPHLLQILRERKGRARQLYKLHLRHVESLTENIHVKHVPGSFELIYGARMMTLRGDYDAIIILGSVIRGETPHFDYICQGVTYGISRINATSEIPVIYGLLTTENMQQALDRCGGKLGNKGAECAITAIKMAKF